MEELKRDWFATREVNCFNVIILCMIITEMDITSLGNKLSQAKSQYNNILNDLLHDKIINREDHYYLKVIYEKLEGEGVIDMFINSVSDITNHPNLINNKWVPDNIIGRSKNKCFPCRNKMQLK